MNLNRRQLIWSAPVIAAAAAVPQAAASTAPASNRIIWTHNASTPGRTPGTAYVKTGVNIVDGPQGLPGLTIFVEINGQTQSKAFPQLPGWGNTQWNTIEFPGLPAGTHAVKYTAVAPNVATIYAETSVTIEYWG